MKKLLSIMLAILMSFSTLCNATVVEAISESMPFNKPSISFETAAGSPGEVVTVPIVISNNPGIIFAAFKINYSPEIILKSVNDSHLLEGFSFIEESNTILITNFVSDDVSKSNVGNGIIAEAIFEISQDILPGEYSLSIECSDEGPLDLNAEEITFECVSSIIKVSEVIYDVALEKDTGFDDEIADSDVGLSDEAVSEDLLPLSADIMPLSTELTSADGRFNYTVSGINATITKYLGTESNLVVPENIDDYIVYGIGSNAFSNCEFLSSIVLPQSVKTIGSSAFRNCSSLSSIDLGGASSLSWGLFAGCPLLTSITIPKSVESASSNSSGEGPLGGSSITEVIFEEDIVNIPCKICYGCETLMSVFVPITVESIGSYAFHNCELLKDIYYEGIDEFYWKQIYIENYNEPLQTATIHYDSKSPINQIPTFENFNIATYRANRLVNPNYYADSKNVRDELSKETPSSIIAKALQDSGFDEGVELWNGVQTAFDSINDPTKLKGYVLKPRDMYMAIIVNAVEKDSTVDYGEVEKAKVTRSISKYMSAVDSMAKAEFQMDIISNTDNYRNLTSEQKEALYAFTMDWFKHETPIWSGAQKLMSTLSNILDLAASVGDCYTYAANCFTFINTTESMKSVLRELYSDSLQNGNSHMQSALSECIDIINSSKEEAILKIIDGEISLAGWGASKFLIKEFLWKEVMKEVYSLCPAMAVLMVAFKASTAVSNALFKTDELSSQYLQLQMVLDMERVSDITYSRLYNKFLGDRTTENAETLLSALDMQFALRAEDCVSASKMVSIVNDSMLHKIMSWFSKNNLDDTLEGIKFYLNSYNDTQIVSGIAWIEELEQDYPETPLFKTYSNSKDDIMSKIEAKQEHIAACPVDVYVYDESNNLVAYVEGNRVHCEDDNITIAIVDDTKYVKTYGDQIYRIEYAGYDAGTMDVTIHEFDESGNTVRDVNYYGVPVDSNTSYDIYANDENLKEDAYSLTNTSTGEVVDEQYDSLKDRTEDNIFTAEIWSGNMIYKGNICFSENLSKGESVEIHAFVPENYTFVKWEASNGKDIFGDSTDPNTTFIMPGEDIVVRAIMSSQSYDITPPTGVSLDKDKITVKVGEAVQLIHTITPENATEKAVVWISDSPEIATVDQEGNVTAIAAGKAIISVSTFDGNCTAT